MNTVIDVLLLIGLGAASLLGMVMAVVQLPGTWLILLAAVGYDWHYDWTRFGPAGLGVVAGAAATAEIVEALSGMVLSRRAQASRRAAWYGLGGGMLGALLLSIPVPVVGTIIGAAIGCFAGAFIAELGLGRGLAVGARSGYYGAIGRTLGSILKVLAAVLMGAFVVSLAVVRMF